MLEAVIWQKSVHLVFVTRLSRIPNHLWLVTLISLSLVPINKGHGIAVGRPIRVFLHAHQDLERRKRDYFPPHSINRHSLVHSIQGFKLLLREPHRKRIPGNQAQCRKHVQDDGSHYAKLIVV